jgi:hypothetical protein
MAWILPLDSSVESDFCTIDNSISLFVFDRSQQYSGHWGGYTVDDIQWQIYIQCKMHSGGYSARYTVPDHDRHSCGTDTQGRRHSSGYIVAEIVADIQHSKHCGRYKAADTPWQIYLQWQIHQQKPKVHCRAL